MQTLKKGSRGTDVEILQELLNLQVDGIFGSLTEERVKEFQSEQGLTADGIVGTRTWAALGINDEEEWPVVKKSKRTIKEIIVHCTATKDGREVTVEDVTQWHKQRGFDTIGYHYLVYLDGTIHNGRDVNVSGAHCSGHNSYSIGVCYVGGLDAEGNSKDTRTDAQKSALVELLTKLRALYPNAKIYGHRDFAAKDCPCFDAKAEYKGI